MYALNLEKAQKLVLERGIPMSKSKLYKLTSSNDIPHRKAGNRLIFFENELTEWCNQQIINPLCELSESKRTIVRSAQGKKIF